MALGDIIEREKHLLGEEGRPLSNRGLARLTEDDIPGGPIFHSTISNWVRGLYGQVDASLLDVLAAAIAKAKHPTAAGNGDRTALSGPATVEAAKLSAEMRAAAGEPARTERPAIDVSELDADEFRIVDDLVRMLIRKKRGSVSPTGEQ